jgi:hypothetical protein
VWPGRPRRCRSAGWQAQRPRRSSEGLPYARDLARHPEAKNQGAAIAADVVAKLPAMKLPRGLGSSWSRGRFSPAGRMARSGLAVWPLGGRARTLSFARRYVSHCDR